MTKRTWWTIGFLGLTAVLLGAEVWGAFDGDPDTRPWTDYITDLPIEVVLALTGALILWLPIHFYRAWKKKQPVMGQGATTVRETRTVEKGDGDGH